MRCAHVVAALCAPVVLFAMAGAAQAGELKLFQSVKNTDVATFSIGQMRDVGSGTLNASGLSGSISSAFLYWHGPTKTYLDDANAYGSFAGHDLIGTNIGFSNDNLWWTPYYESQAYRADVTDIFTGNGDYLLQYFQGSNGTTNGMSLIVFYQDGDASNDRDVMLFDGNDSNRPNFYDADGWNATLDGLDYAGNGATLSLGVSDGQYRFQDGELRVNGTLIDSGNMFDGATAQLGNGNDQYGSLWDVKTYDVSGLLDQGSNTLTVTNSFYSDALSLVFAQYSTPSATVSAVPEPASWAMLIGGFGAIGGVMRRRRARAQFA